MADFTLNDLDKILQKAGAPTGNSVAMKAFLPGLEQAVAGAVGPRENPALAGMRSNYKAQLDQIAAMDQKLAQLYGDPSSKLYIAKGSTRQNAISGAANQGYQAASGLRKGIEQTVGNDERETKSAIADAVQYYKQLTTLQAQEERLNDKQSKQNLTAIKKQKEETAKALGYTTAEFEQVADAKLGDQETANYFLNLPTAFRKQWVRDRQQAAVAGDEDADIVYGIQDLEQALKAFDAKYSKKKAKSTVFGAQSTASTPENLF